MDKQHVIYTYGGKVFSLKKGMKLFEGGERNEILIHPTTRMNLEVITLSEKEPDTKGKILYNSTYMEYSELDKFIET